MRFYSLLPAVAFFCLLGFSQLGAAETGYYRFPAIVNNTIAFTAEGDLWVGQLDSKNYQRLTTHPAEEKQPSISMDGKTIAFVAKYQDTNEIYVIPVTGGIAKQITFEHNDVRVQGWTADGNVLYSTNGRVGPTGNWTLHLINPDNLIEQAIPLADAVEGVIDPKGEMIYFTQFGLQVSHDNTKVYRGGAKGEIWRFKMGASNEAQKLTSNHIGSARSPMYGGDKIYFISDAGGNDNIWSMSFDGTNPLQITKYTQWPVRTAKLDKGRIIYQVGADLKLLDLKSNESSELSINLTSDFPSLRDNWVNQPLKYVTSINLSDNAEKVVITARGKVAIAGIDKSRLVEVATNAESRTRNAILSHDGQSVYAINDASGELELWQFSADGSDKAKQLTKDGNIFRWNLTLSPDGLWLTHDDKNGDLWLYDLSKGNNKKILSNNIAIDPFTDVVWSTDSQLLAITRNQQTDERSRIQLYSIRDEKTEILTSDKYNSFSPAFSPDGNWLYFLSERHFDANPTSPWGDRNMGPQFDRRAQIFAYALTTNNDFPFQTAHELMIKKDDDVEDKDKDKSSKSKHTEKKLVQIDWKNIKQRLWQVPVSAGNYSRLSVNKDYLFLLDQITEPDSKPSIKSIKIKASPKIENFADNIADYQLSIDGKKLFVRQEGGDNANLFIVDAGDKFPTDTAEAKVNASDWKLLLNPRQEWNQIFHDAWLMHRDSLFDKEMRGVNWGKVKQKYQPLLDRVTDRYELNDVFSQMMGELNALHSQVRGGDFPEDIDSAKVSTLGANLIQTNQGVLVKNIYQHEYEQPLMAPPLSQPGVNAQTKDIIVSINGVATPSLSLVNRQLQNQAGKQVLLVLKRNNQLVKTIVTPSTADQDYQFRYDDWVITNKLKVETSTQQIGYLHLHAMGANDVASFARDFYANYNKSGLIIDVRRNRGGNIDSWIIEKLLRKAWSFWQPTIGRPFTNMQQTFRGHLVVLADQFTYSDGETFTAGVRALNIAPIIGKQTAGAGVWLSGNNGLTDNGMARVAEYPQYSMDGRWIVEAYGVKPDIEVDNFPNATFDGNDAQLNAAINYLKKKMADQPILPLKAQDFPEGIEPAQDILQ